MKKQRILALLTAVLTLFTCLVMPIHASGSLSLTFADDVQEGSSLSLGDTVTYTVMITGNEGGFTVGTFFFLPSENLQYESATLLGEEADAKQAIDGENAGAYGIKCFSAENITVTDTVLCTMTFRVIGLGDATVRFYAYQLIDRDVEAIEVQIAPDTLTHPVATPDKPAVLTESLKNGVMGKLYTAVLESDFRADIDEKDLSWEVTDGALPVGLELLNDGTLTGTPTEFGAFTFSVTFSIFDSIASDAKELTLTILEKPRKLELTDESTYAIGDDGYLRNVVAETTLSALLGNFLNPESIKVFDAKGGEITDGSAFIGTGCVVSLMDGEEAVHSVTVLVLGDVDGNGIIGTRDYQRVRAYYSGTYVLTGVALEAAKVSGRDEIGTLDYQRIRRHFNGTYNIYA